MRISTPGDRNSSLRYYYQPFLLIKPQAFDIEEILRQKKRQKSGSVIILL